MELQLVSFTQAKALKKLGMPINIQKFCYAGDGNLYYIVNKDFYPAPTLELAAKWIREEKGIILLPTPMMKWSERTEKYYSPHYRSCYTHWNSPVLSTLKEKDKYGNLNPIEFATYEEALSAGIDKAIEILQKN